MTFPMHVVMILTLSLQVDIMFQGATIDDKGNFNYKDFAQVLKHGE